MREFNFSSAVSAFANATRRNVKTAHQPTASMMCAPLGFRVDREAILDVAPERLAIRRVERRHCLCDLPVEVGFAENALGDLSPQPLLGQRHERVFQHLGWRDQFARAVDLHLVVEPFD